jgi:hypothetical protein
MRLIAIFIATLIYAMTNAQNVSLKIQNDDSYYYPSNLEFEVIDDQGKTVLTQNDLEANKPIVIEGNYTVNVFTTWGTGKDTFKVEDKALISFEEQGNKVNLNKDMNCCSDTYTGYGESWKENQPDIINQSFEANSDGYAAIIEFENDIFFNYLDGEAKITQNGKTLKLVGKYVAKTSEGYLKLSYNPKNKELWYVFTDTYEKVVYQ